MKITPPLRHPLGWTAARLMSLLAPGLLAVALHAVEPDAAVPAELDPVALEQVSELGELLKQEENKDREIDTVRAWLDQRPADREGITVLAITMFWMQKENWERRWRADTSKLVDDLKGVVTKMDQLKQRVEELTQESEALKARLAELKQPAVPVVD